jgi:hypothetical protein
MLAVELQRGDYVRTEKGEVGKVVHISRLTVFVAIPVSGTDDRIDAFLEGQLTRVNLPHAQPLN